MSDAIFEQIWLKGRHFWLLRDDLIGGEFNGNKARKLAFLLDANLAGKKRIVSYGSNQSNAMYSLSILAKKKGLEFLYFTHHIGEFLRHFPGGNYAGALANGAVIRPSAEPGKDAREVCGESDIFIPEGVATKEAELGIRLQAEDITKFASSRGLDFDIFLPSGTGCSAGFLAKNLPQMRVFTTPCVGDERYLRAQIKELCGECRARILNGAKKYYFGKIYKELYDMHKMLKDATGVEFELLYDSVGWIRLLENLKSFKKDILYIHQGGLLGNVTLLERYRRKFGE